MISEQSVTKKLDQYKRQLYSIQRPSVPLAGMLAKNEERQCRAAKADRKLCENEGCLCRISQSRVQQKIPNRT